MTRRVLTVAQFVLAGVFLAASVLSWVSARSLEPAAPVAPGEPSVLTAIYDPALIGAALVFLAVSGVLVVFAVTGRRS